MPRLRNILVAVLAIGYFLYMRYVDRTWFGDRVYEKTWRPVKKALYRGRGVAPMTCPTVRSRAVMRSADCPSFNAKGSALRIGRYHTQLNTEDHHTRMGCNYHDGTTCQYIHSGGPVLHLTEADSDISCAKGFSESATIEPFSPLQAEDAIYLGTPQWDCQVKSQNGTPLSMVILSKGPNVDYAGGFAVWQCAYGAQGCVYSYNGSMDARFSEPECMALPKLCPVVPLKIAPSTEAPRKSVAMRGQPVESGRV